MLIQSLNTRTNTQPLKFADSQSVISAPDEAEIKTMMSNYVYGKPLEALCNNIQVIPYNKYLILKDFGYLKSANNKVMGVCDELCEDLYQKLKEKLDSHYEIRMVTGNVTDYFFSGSGFIHVFFIIAPKGRRLESILSQGETIPSIVSVIDPSFQRIVQGTNTKEYSFLGFKEPATTDLFAESITNYEIFKFEPVGNGYQISSGRPIGFLKDLTASHKPGLIYLGFLKKPSGEIIPTLAKQSYSKGNVYQWDDWTTTFSSHHPLTIFMKRLTSQLDHPDVSEPDLQKLKEVDRRYSFQRIDAFYTNR